MIDIELEVTDTAFTLHKLYDNRHSTLKTAIFFNVIRFMSVLYSIILSPTCVIVLHQEKKTLFATFIKKYFLKKMTK